MRASSLRAARADASTARARALRVASLAHVRHADLVHAPALLWAATAEPFLQGTILCWVLGILLFSGSLYALALTKISILGAITPIGGLFLMAGWAIVGIRAFKS